jgi:hypothetical protein
MKKTKLLALTLVVAVMLVGAGYAYWSESLSIGTTVDTGDLEVIFQEPANVNGEELPPYQPNADCTPTNGGKGMAVTFKEAYPGLENDFEFTLANIGTLGAYVDDFTIATDTNLNTDLILCKGIQIGNNVIPYNGTLEQALNYLSKGKGIFVDTTLVNGDGNYSYTTGTEYVKLSLQFSPSANNENFIQDVNGNKDLNYYFTINANVHQFNE